MTWSRSRFSLLSWVAATGMRRPLVDQQHAGRVHVEELGAGGGEGVEHVGDVEVVAQRVGQRDHDLCDQLVPASLTAGIMGARRDAATSPEPTTCPLQDLVEPASGPVVSRMSTTR